MTRFGLPLLRKELIERSSTPRHYLERVGFSLLVFGIFIVAVYDASLDELISGQGRTIFQILYVLTCIVIFVGVPACVAGAIPMERERGSLDLLRVTTLSRSEIVLEKFLGRLLPFAVIMLILLPAVAGLYAFGGLTRERLWVAALSLALLALQVGALSLVSGVRSATPAWSLNRAYCMVLLVYGLLPALGMVAEFGLSVSYAHVPILLYAFEETGSDLVTRTLIVLATVVVCLAITRAWLWRPPFGQAAAMRRRQQIAERLETTDGERASDGSLPREKPVRWRVVRSNYWFKKRFLIVTGVAIVALAFSISLGLFGMAGPFIYHPIVLVIWLLGFIVIVTRGANLVIGERSKQSLDVLLTTTLSAREIVTQKIAPLWRVVLWVGVVSGLVGAIGVPAWLDGFGTLFQQEEPRPDVAWACLSAFGGALVAAAVYLFAATWLAVWIGLHASRYTRAVIGVILLAFASSFVPALAHGILGAIFGWLVPIAIVAAWSLRQSARYPVRHAGAGVLIGLGVTAICALGEARGFPTGPATTLSALMIPMGRLNEAPTASLVLYLTAGIALRGACLAAADARIRRPAGRRAA